MNDLIFSNESFGLRYDAPSQSWQIIFESNLNTTSTFSLANAGDTTNTKADSSWMLLFTTDTVTYTITERASRYVFESASELTFYFDSSVKIYDTISSQTISDVVKVLSINPQPGYVGPLTQDYSFQVVSEYFGQDGYIDPSKLVITFNDPLNNGTVDNPQGFIDIVTPSITVSATGSLGQSTIAVSSTTGIGIGMTVFGQGIGQQATVVSISGSVITLSVNNTAIVNNTVTFNLVTYIVEQLYSISTGQEDYEYVSNDPVNGPVIITKSTATSTLSPTSGQYYYFTDTQVVVQYNSVTALYEPTLDYKVFVGRDNLKFQYTHSADYDSRIDPGSSNIIDVYVLTNSYDTAFRQWLLAGGTEPLAPSQAELNDLLSPNLNLIKSISDEIVYHPVNYTLLFGSAAPDNLQANFEAVINPNSAVSSANVQARILTAINNFFALANWDFGDTFYFTELATYVMQQLAPDIISFVIVPVQVGQYFGSLFEIQCPSDTLFISCATTDNIQIVTGLTSTNLKTVTGSALATTVASQQITSANYGANS
jgi:hypothetical protein